MFNRQSVFFGGETTSNTNIKVNAVSGGIVKNHADSYFLKFNLRDVLSETLLSPNPYRRRDATFEEKRLHNEKHYSELKYIDIPVEVLQLVVVGDMEVVAEVIDIKDDTSRS